MQTYKLTNKTDFYFSVMCLTAMGWLGLGDYLFLDYVLEYEATVMLISTRLGFKLFI
jgi:hypothetical protein